MFFTDKSGVEGEILFTGDTDKENTELRGFGDITVGATLLKDCEVVIDTKEIILRKTFELSLGEIKVHFTFGNDLLWFGKAEYSEELECGIVENKHIQSTFNFYLHDKASALDCDITTNLFGIKHQSLYRSVNSLCSDWFNSILQEIKDSLLKKLLEKLNSIEKEFSSMDLATIEGYNNLSFGEESSVFKRPNKIDNDQADSLTIGSGITKGYLQRKNVPVKSKFTPEGYISSKKTLNQNIFGYLSHSFKQRGIINSSNGYLLNKNKRKADSTDNSKPLPFFPIVEVPYIAGLSREEQNMGNINIFESSIVNINYIEIKDYAYQILNIKEIIRGLLGTTL